MCRVKVASKKLLVKVAYTKIIVYQMPLVCAHIRDGVARLTSTGCLNLEKEVRDEYEREMEEKRKEN